MISDGAIDASVVGGDGDLLPGSTCKSCSAKKVYVRPSGSIPDPRVFPYGCENCGNLRADEVEIPEPPSMLELLAAARPREFRLAGLELLETLVDACHKAVSVAEDLRLTLEHPLVPEPADDVEQIARWVETRGLLEGLAARAPTVKGVKFASVLQDGLDLAADMLDRSNGVPVIVPGVESRGAPMKALKKRLAERVRELLRPPADMVEETHAFLDPERRYRYVLRRTWDHHERVMVFVMLNPSTADEQDDDPTVRRCRDFAKREGCGGITIVNLFAFRSSRPQDLLLAADPVGPENDHWLEAHVGSPGAILVCAWGALEIRLLPRAKIVLDMIRSKGVAPLCLGTTKDGHPRHPVRLARTTALVPYDGTDVDGIGVA